MPTAFQALLKDDGSGGGGLVGEHELCALSYNSSDEPTEVVVLVKNEASDELWAEKPSDLPKPSDLSLLDEKLPSNVSNGSSGQPMMDKSPSKNMPAKAFALGLTGEGNIFSKKTAKENASPQKGSNSTLFASGGESEGRCGTMSSLACANVNNDLPAPATTKRARSGTENESGPAKKRSKRKKCSSEGCANIAQKGGICIRHGAKVKLCSNARCTNLAQKGGVCQRHGAKPKRCNWLGCTNESIKGGVCRRHGAQAKQCSKEGCTNNSLRGGVCWRHGAKDLAKKAQKRKV